VETAIEESLREIEEENIKAKRGGKNRRNRVNFSTHLRDVALGTNVGLRIQI